MHTAANAAIQAQGEARSIASSVTHSTALPRLPLPPRILDLIAATMTSAFAHRWTSAHGDNFAETSGRIWAHDLAGMTDRQIMRGLDTAKRNPDGWPPVLVDFRAYCLGVLPLVEVDANLQRPVKEWTPYSVLVKRQINDAHWRMSSPDAQWHLLERAYARAKAHVLAGGRLPEYTPASQQLTKEDRREPPPPFVMSAEDCIAEIRKTLRMPEAAPEPPTPIVERAPVPCVRCEGTMRDPIHTTHRLQTVPGECIACYGSGVEHAFNRIVRLDGSIQDRLL